SILPNSLGFCVSMVHSTINFWISTPYIKALKRLDNLISLYQTYALNMKNMNHINPNSKLNKN
ncbi:MAG: hypothetical protein ACI35S_03745, partial [Anaeroplasma sp.]